MRVHQIRGVWDLNLKRDRDATGRAVVTIHQIRVILGFNLKRDWDATGRAGNTMRRKETSARMENL